MNVKELLANNRDEIIRVARKHGARNLRIFGSVVRDEARTDSDIDFLIEMEPDRSLLDQIDLIHELEEILGRPVDVVTEKALHWYIKDKVIQEAVPL